ncbi:DsbA family protein [Patescibacteria group bacterium]|nr:DsbA family protein [Patescibacteria group bacterium]MBU0964434.1 DsbA family protein [Patescibacteria group bacterium]
MDNKENYKSASTTKSKKKKKWPWIVGAVLLIFIILIFYFYSLVVNNLENLNAGIDGEGTFTRITTTDDPYLGNPDADIVIVEFSDFQCPYCFQTFPIMHDVVDKYADEIKYIYRDFPLSDIHPQAQMAAEAGECAQDQGKFWAMHDKMFINRDDLSLASLKNYATEIGLNIAEFVVCLEGNKYKEEVEEDYFDGLIAGVDGTPTFYVNDHKFEGVPTYENFQELIEELITIYEAEQ